jgi:hypothetical protein
MIKPSIAAILIRHVRKFGLSKVEIPYFRPINVSIGVAPSTTKGKS